MVERLRAKHELWFFVAVCSVIAGGAFWLQRSILQAELLGYDGYALIIASRIQDVSDFYGTFTEVMMDGRLPAGEFYRPMSNLVLAADYAVWGLEPFGYQLTSLLIWCATVAALPVLVCRVVGRTAWVGAGVAALFYAMHPASLSILPYVARRPETLVLLFTAAALCVLPRNPEGARFRRYVLAGVFALLAMASKESGVLAVGLIFLHQCLAASSGGMQTAVRTGARAALPAALLCAMLFALRFAVIGGIGGYAEAQTQSTLEKMMFWVPEYLASTLRSEGFGWPVLYWLVPATSLTALSALAVALFRLRVRRGGEDLQRIPTLFVLGGVWLLAQVVLACASLHYTTTYLLGMCFAMALAIAALAEGAVIVIRRGGNSSRWQGALALAVVLAVCAIALRGSPAVHDYPELARASRIQQQLLSALALRVEVTPSYEYIDLKLPRNVPVDSISVEPFWMISWWGLQAWADLSFPDHEYKVTLTQIDGAFDEEFATVTLSETQSATP